MDELRGSRTDLSSLARLFVYMSSLRDSRAIAEVAVRSLGRVLPVETGQLLMLDDDGQLIESTEWSATAQAPEPLPVASLRALRARMDASAVSSCSTRPRSRARARRPQLRSVVLIPLRANGRRSACSSATSRFAREFDRGQGELASLLAAHAAASLDAAIALDRERRSAHTDALTGLLNRRGLEDRLDRELGGAQDERAALSLVVLDCDDFKDVNDRAGHEFGDALLREVGVVLRRTCPEGARLRGSEETSSSSCFPAPTPTWRSRRPTGSAVELAAGLDDAGFPLRLSAGIRPTRTTAARDPAASGRRPGALPREGGGKNQVIGFREILRGGDRGSIPPRAPTAAGPGARTLRDRRRDGRALRSGPRIPWRGARAAEQVDRLRRRRDGDSISKVEGTRLATRPSTR